MASINEEITGKQYLIYSIISIIISSFGILANLTFFVVLILKHIKSRYTKYILVNQALSGSCICVVSILKLTIPTDISTGKFLVDIIICFTWTNQDVVWFIVMVGIYTLVFTAVDRYWAVVTPQVYQINICRKIILTFMFIYLFPIFFLGISFSETRFINGTCNTDGESISGPAGIFLRVYSVLYFLVLYLIPAIVMICLHWKIHHAMHQLKGNERELKRTCRSLTRATIILVFIFISTYFYDSFFYLLSYFNVVSYVVNSPFQLIGVSLSTTNSVVNPIVYISTTKSFRMLFISIWFKFKSRNASIEPSIFQSTTHL